VSESLKSKREWTSAVTTLLERFQGEPRWEGPSDPLDSLVRTLLSQSTNDNNRDLAYGRLRRGFHTWREVMEAPRAAVAEAIRPAGLSNQKSERLIAMLRWIEAEFGELNLGFLHEMPIDEAFKRFTRVKGIGVKTVAVKTFELMAPLVPPGKSYSLHMNLLRFGRTVCTARKPKCLECSLYDLCKWPEKPKKN
jgi:endonuclease-3